MPTNLDTIEGRLKFLIGDDSTTRKFASFMGVSKSAIHNYLKGTKPNWDFLEKLANKGVNINWLLTGKGDPHLENYEKLKREHREAAIVKKKTPKHEKQK